VFQIEKWLYARARARIAFQLEQLERWNSSFRNECKCKCSNNVPTNNTCWNKYKLYIYEYVFRQEKANSYESLA